MPKLDIHALELRAGSHEIYLTAVHGDEKRTDLGKVQRFTGAKARIEIDEIEDRLAVKEEGAPEENDFFDPADASDGDSSILYRAKDAAELIRSGVALDTSDEERATVLRAKPSNGGEGSE